MSVQLTPTKRPYEQSSTTEQNGKGKWMKSGASPSVNSPPKTGCGSFSLRMLWPASKISRLTGEDGNAILEICKETGATIDVKDVPGCDERVVVITESEANVKHDMEDGKEQGSTGGSEDRNDYGSNDGKNQVHGKDLKAEKEISSIRKALLIVFEKLVENESEVDGRHEESDKSVQNVVRLLLLSGQVGCLLGKGGSVIKQLSLESGAYIRILPRDKLPLSASASDEVVQISGEIDAVRNSLQSVLQQLMQNLPTDGDPLSWNAACPPYNNTMPNYSFPTQAQPYGAGPCDDEGDFPGHMYPAQDILTFRLLCQVDKVGGVIGKGGTVVKALQRETGCEIKVLEGLPEPDPENRIIAISGPVHPDARISAPQDALLRILPRIVRSKPESKDNTVLAKILVSSHQIGCLLGKGGSIIAEMRKLSGAYIRILGKDQIPKCAAENEEVVQINGDFEAVQEAFMHITTRLKNHFLRDAFPSANHPPFNPGFPDHVPPFAPFMDRRKFSPPGVYSNFGPSFSKFDGVGLPPPGRFGFHDDGPPFMHNFHRAGVPPHVSEKLPSSVPWDPRGLIEGGGPVGLPEYSGAPQRRFGGFGGGSNPAIITNTTMEVVVPRSVVPAIYGEDGGCIKQIREISDAKITISDPEPGATETVITISGTPEQTHAAQSLIQAFVISETQAL